MAASATIATRIPYSGSWRSRWSVIWVRVLARGVGRARAIVEERVGVVAREPLGEPLAELLHPRWHVRVLAMVAAHFVQVVRRTAGSDDEDALVRERRERLADPVVVPRIGVVLDRELGNRHVRVRIHKAQRNPRAVVEPALRVDLRGEPGRLQQRGRAPRHLRRTGRRIAELVQRLREAPEIVDRLRPRLGAHGRTRRTPVRRGDKHRLRPRDLGGDPREPGTGRAGIEREHRRAVRDEDRGQRRHSRLLGRHGPGSQDGSTLPCAL